MAGSLRNGCRMCLEQLDVTIQIVHHLGVPAGSAMARHHRSAIWICMVKATYMESRLSRSEVRTTYDMPECSTPTEGMAGSVPQS